MIFNVEVLAINPDQSTQQQIKAEYESKFKTSKRQRRPNVDLEPVGDPRTHYCFNPLILYASLVLLFVSFVYLLMACFRKETLSKIEVKGKKRESVKKARND